MAHGRTRMVLIPLVAALILAACTSSSTTNSATGSAGSKPIVIGISLSQSGDFSDPGAAALRGYQLWADTVNANGGILGRQVQLKIADDASDPNQAVTNYENFITKDKVDLVFGPFSTLLSVPSAQIANRYGYSFVEPAGGGPQMFDAKLPNVFFVQPAPVLACGQPFVYWILSLPASQRPKTAAYRVVNHATTGKAVVCQYLVTFGGAPSVVGVAVSLMDATEFATRVGASMIAPPEAVPGVGTEAYLVAPAPGLFEVWVSGPHGYFKVGAQTKATAIALATIAAGRN